MYSIHPLRHNEEKAGQMQWQSTICIPSRGQRGLGAREGGRQRGKPAAQEGDELSVAYIILAREAIQRVLTSARSSKRWPHLSIPHLSNNPLQLFSSLPVSFFFSPAILNRNHERP
jgi:hypothetical protein